MEICSSNHDEIVYDSRYCPLCELLEEKEELNSEIRNLEHELNTATSQKYTYYEILKEHLPEYLI